MQSRLLLSRRRPRDLDRAVLADRIVHAVGIAAAVAGGILLLARAALSPVPGQLLPVVVYVGGLLAMLVSSGAYHVWGSSRHREWLRRIDHAAIFVMIAGTYTPLAVLALARPWDIVLTAAAWTAAAGGVILKLVQPHRIESISVGLYLLLGWMGVIVIGQLLSSVETMALLMLLIGGLVYSGGVVFHLSSRRYHVALWHGCVLLGAAFHYVAIASLVQA